MKFFNFYHLVVLIYLLIFAVTDIPFLNIIFIVFCFIYFLFKNSYESIYSILLLIPLMDIFIFDGIPLINILVLYAFFLFIIRIKFLKEKKLQKWLFLFLSLFIVYDLVHYFFIPFKTYFQVFELLTWSISVLFFVILISAVETNFSNESAQKYFVIGTGYSILYGLIKRYQEVGVSDLFIMNNTVDRINGASGDPNYYSMYILLSIIFLMYSLISNKNKHNWILIIMIISYFVFGLLSLSRMYIIIATLLIVILLPIFIKKYLVNKLIIDKIKILFYITIISIIFIPIFKDMITENISTIITRLQLDNVQDLTSNRNIIFSQYLDSSFDNIFNLLFGIGIIKYNIRSEVIAFAHNLYIELLVAWGIVGILLLFIIILAVAFKYIYNNKIKINTLRLLPLFIILISGMSLNILEIEAFYILIFLCISILKEPNSTIK